MVFELFGHSVLSGFFVGFSFNIFSIQFIENLHRNIESNYKLVSKRATEQIRLEMISPQNPMDGFEYSAILLRLTEATTKLKILPR